LWRDKHLIEEAKRCDQHCASRCIELGFAMMNTKVKQSCGASLWVWGFLALVLLLTGWQRWHLRTVPLERDEGEYVYQGQLILQGAVPFQVAYSSQKFPGIYLAAAVSEWMFGPAPVGIHVGLMFVNLLSLTLFFLWARRYCGDGGALMGTGALALLSVSHTALAFAAHATHYVVLPMLAGFLVLDFAAKKGRLGWYFLAGLFFGISVTMRQPAVFFGIWAFVLIFIRGAQAKAPLQLTVVRALVYGIGSVLPVVLIIGWLWRAGVWDRFIYWTFTYAASYGSQTTLQDGWQNFVTTFPRVVNMNWPLWVMSGLGFAGLLWKRPSGWWELVGFGFASLLALASGLYFREHYFIQFLPLVALGIAFATRFHDLFLPKKTAKEWSWVGITVFAVAWIISMFGQADYLFVYKPDTYSRAVYGYNPFPEALEVARYLQQHTKPSDKVVVLGSEPEIYAYAQRRAASGYYITYPLTEPTELARDMQLEMIREIEAEKPAYIVFVNVITSWLPRNQKDRQIFEWTGPYLEKNYQLDGLVDLSPEGTIYLWGAEAMGHQPRTDTYLTIHRRK
jgi:hypothetical protein